MFTGIIWTLLILETFEVAASQNTCEIKHLQQIYCSNDNVFKAYLLNTTNETDTYKMRILKFFKGGPKKLHRSDKNYKNVKMNIYTHNLIANKFLILGHTENETIVTDPCSGVYPWKSLTVFQKNALNALYENVCDCVSEIPQYNVSMSCIWQHGSFLRENGQCVSSGGKSLRKCRRKTKQKNNSHRRKSRRRNKHRKNHRG